MDGLLEDDRTSGDHEAINRLELVDTDLGGIHKRRHQSWREGVLLKIDVYRRREGRGRGQAKIDVYNFCIIISPFEEIYRVSQGKPLYFFQRL